MWKLVDTRHDPLSYLVVETYLNVQSGQRVCIRFNPDQYRNNRDRNYLIERELRKYEMSTPYAQLGVDTGYGGSTATAYNAHSAYYSDNTTTLRGTTSINNCVVDAESVRRAIDSIRTSMTGVSGDTQIKPPKAKVSKQIRHQYLRKRLKERLTKN